MLLNDFRVFVKYFFTGSRPEREGVEVAVILHKRKMKYESNGKNENIRSCS